MCIKQSSGIAPTILFTLSHPIAAFHLDLQEWRKASELTGNSLIYWRLYSQGNVNQTSVAKQMLLVCAPAL